MPFYRSIRSRRSRRKVSVAFDLQLTSMMDILVIMLVFLLKSYSTSVNSFVNFPGLKLPVSNSPDIPPDSLHVIVTPEGMTFENVRILDFVQNAAAAGGTDPTYSLKGPDVDEGGRRIIPLYDALIRSREKAELLRAKSPARDKDGNPLPFEGILAIQADRSVHYDTIRRIMYTSAAAGYKVFRFLARGKER